MIEKMEMDAERLREVLTLSRIGLPEESYQEVLDRVNDILRLCDKMRELAHEEAEPFEWDVKKAPARRADEPVRWSGRDLFLSEAPVRDGDFFRVPRIIALEDDGEEE
ncbi:MAG: Asp-tRNA(Asn)/Glu-tRNA(Gln) amidotransferase subunit GatC [Synergistaceae bacterium]|nr:Asp-tRNA(Asn)/Glu-tRNA(Gln) amidotransferase subunit GatC [Synergistaceae bacterium]